MSRLPSLCRHNAFMSSFLAQDFARTWTNLTANSEGAVTSFWDFDWGATLQRNTKDSFPDETIFATAYESATSMKGPKPGWDKDMHFVMSSDFFRSAHKKLVSCGNQFELIGAQVRPGCARALG